MFLYSNISSWLKSPFEFPRTIDSSSAYKMYFVTALCVSYRLNGLQGGKIREKPTEMFILLMKWMHENKNDSQFSSEHK